VNIFILFFVKENHKISQIKVSKWFNSKLCEYFKWETIHSQKKGTKAVTGAVNAAYLNAAYWYLIGT